MDFPQCKNPEHPRGHSRDSMKVMKETPEWVSFVCEICLGEKIQSIQVRHLRPGVDKARYTLSQRANQKMQEMYKRFKGRVVVSK